MPARLRPLAAAVLLLVPAAAAAQEDTTTVVPAPEPMVAAVRVFLDCQSGGCDFDYLRTEIPWVDYVRDRADADVHVLVSRIRTGSGGEEYTLDLRGLQRLRGVSDTLRFASGPGDAGDRVRAALARTLAIGLVRYAAGTPQAEGLRVVYSAPAPRRGAATAASDPWNAWVYRIGGGGSFNEEERRKDRRINGSLSARRITEAWKFGVSGNANVVRETYVLRDRTTRNVRESYNGGAVAIRSLGAHWGAGAQLAVGSSTFNNQRLALRMAPAVEYSIFPYAEATRRQLTVQYSVGTSHFRYEEETIFERLQETLPSHALVVGYDVRQPWGSADATLEAANYLNDFSKHRVNFSGRVNLRLYRGLELNVGGSASLVRDQLSIPRSDASEEDVLLQRRALLTNYRYAGNVGFSYTFGSIFNSVVNPRFGSGTGDILR